MLYDAGAFNFYLIGVPRLCALPLEMSLTRAAFWRMPHYIQTMQTAEVRAAAQDWDAMLNQHIAKFQAVKRPGKCYVY